MTTVVALVLSLLASISCSAKDNTAAAAASNKVEVYYFHYTRRCMTCNTVESETKKALSELYPAQMQSGAITFKSVNLDEDASKALADKCQASGQNLLVVSGTSRTDLTNQAFMNAVNDPGKLKAEIKKTIDPLIKAK